MEECVCSKENELGQISTDVKRLVKIVDGNGQPGLTQTIPELNTLVETLLKNMEAKERNKMNGWQKASVIVSAILGCASICTALIVKFAK